MAYNRGTQNMSWALMKSQERHNGRSSNFCTGPSIYWAGKPTYGARALEVADGMLHDELEALNKARETVRSKKEKDAKAARRERALLAAKNAKIKKRTVVARTPAAKVAKENPKTRADARTKPVETPTPECKKDRTPKNAFLKKLWAKDPRLAHYI